MGNIYPSFSITPTNHTMKKRGKDGLNDGLENSGAVEKSTNLLRRRAKK